MLNFDKSRNKKNISSDIYTAILTFKLEKKKKMITAIKSSVPRAEKTIRSHTGAAHIGENTICIIVATAEILFRELLKATMVIMQRTKREKMTTDSIFDALQEHIYFRRMKIRKNVAPRKRKRKVSKNTPKQAPSTSKDADTALPPQRRKVVRVFNQKTYLMDIVKELFPYTQVDATAKKNLVAIFDFFIIRLVTPLHPSKINAKTIKKSHLRSLSTVLPVSELVDTEAILQKAIEMARKFKKEKNAKSKLEKIKREKIKQEMESDD